MACLRICIEHGARESAVEGVTPAKIDKTSSAYIDAHWPPPRRYGRVAPGAYVLVDPNAEYLDGEELRHMASELQLRLFGTQGRDDLCMLTFEGDEEQVLKFSTLTEEELLAMRGGKPPPPEGRTRVIRGDSVQELASWGSTPRKVAAKPKVEAPTPIHLGWRGVYNLANQKFESSEIMVVRKPGAPEPQDDSEFAEHDLLAFDRAVAALEADPTLKAWVGVRMWSVVRAGIRDGYQARLTALSPNVRERLAAVVYEVPRDLPFSAIAPLRDLVQPNFARVFLKVHDPGFYCQAVPEGLAYGIVLQLEGDDEKSRLLKIHRFLNDRKVYAGRRLRQGLAGVRNARELELARRMGANTVKGPFISGLFATPVAEQETPIDELPLAV
ncbi:hypothetical protein CSW59_20255 [Caulobacter sp. BP25]|nr:hypothetical protein CSW59_20255 [Caulobacter sp. BP25]